MILRIQLGKTGKIAIRWMGNLLMLAGLLSLGYSLVSYLQMEFYQRIESQRLESALDLGMHLDSRLHPSSLKVGVQPGAPFGRIEIPRLGISAMIVEGVRPHDLKLAVGHIPGTAFPGESSNVALAGHRDTFFRKLGRVRDNDLITLTTLHGIYRYRVESTGVVQPTDVDVLDPTPNPALTLVTCYPLSYVGPAPERFIVRARSDW